MPPGKNISLLLLLSTHFCSGVSTVQGARVVHIHQGRVLLKYFFIMTVICSPSQWCLSGAGCTGGAMPPGKNISLLLLLSTHFCSGVSMVQGRVLLKYFFIMTVICSPLQWCLHGAGCTGGAMPPGKNISLLLLLSTHFCSGVSMVQGRVLLKYFFIMTVICSPLQWCLRGAGCTGGAMPPGKNISLLLLLSTHFCSGVSMVQGKSAS